MRGKGEGTLFKEKTGLWVAEISLPGGKRKRKRAKTQSEVKAWLLAQREAVRDGMVVENDKLTFGQFFDRYYQDILTHNVQPKTLESYESISRIHILPALSAYRLSAITPQLLQSLYADKLKSGLSPRTVHYIHTLIHKALKQALKWGMVTRNVADLVDKPSQKRKAPNVWSADQANRFLNEINGHRWYPIYVIAIYCGLREGEILGLRVEDIDLMKRTLYVRQAVQYLLGKGLIIKEPKSEAGKRSVTIPGFAVAVLTDHLLLIKKDSGLIFTTGNDTPISPRNLIRHFKSVIGELDLPDIRFHDLRHTHASLLLAAGVNPKVVQERLGHSSVTLTLNTYSHVMPGLQEAAADKFDDLLNNDSMVKFQPSNGTLPDQK